MSKFYTTNGQIHVMSDESMDLKSFLTPDVYLLKYDKMSLKFYLETASKFTVPKKIYGKINEYADRVEHYFLNEAVGNLGVLLTGAKGNGKTLLGKIVSTKLLKANIPTIIITENYTGTDFLAVLQLIKEKCVVLIDEFEKIFTQEEQEIFLGLLEGTHESNKLFILTANEPRYLNHHFFNRPGRLRYYIKFDDISNDFIRDYCYDNLRHKSRLQDVLDISNKHLQFNFDMLKTLVSEINIYNDPSDVLLDILNIKYNNVSSRTYAVELQQTTDPPKYKNATPTRNEIDANVSGPWSLALKYLDADNSIDWLDLLINPTDILSKTHNSIIYKTDDFIVILKAV